tara:strand:- start:225 stop:617 length:393 start_codon:yes stop_codon:yes gene_type:complete
MNINNIIKESLLMEGKFHELNAKVEFTFDLHHDTGGHTANRKWRHGSGEKIYDIDIVDLLDDAKEEIIYSIIDGDIRNGRRFIVSRDGGNYLNIVIKPEELSVNHWNLVTITVMKNQDFNVGKGQLKIVV